MFEWLQRIFGESARDEQQSFFEMVDSMNAEAGGGTPTRIERSLGNLTIRSRTLVLGDPQYIPSIEISNFVVDEVSISASLWLYPSGYTTVEALKIETAHDGSAGAHRKIGELAIDSAKVVVVDKADFNEHWTEVGKDRIGVVNTARDDKLLRVLTKQFKIRFTQVNVIRAEAVEPVSEALEKEIEEYLESIPRYADYPFMHFYVQTNNSFDRANRMERSWDFLPVGNNETPQMFVCGTGHGDGGYDVLGHFADETPLAISISFIDENEYVDEKNKR